MCAFELHFNLDFMLDMRHQTSDTAIFFALRIMEIRVL